jgi:hypothetical protein
MLIIRNRKRFWNRFAAWLIVPSALCVSLASAQETVPAPAVQEVPVRPMDDIPPPPDGLAPASPADSAPGVIPGLSGTPGSVGGCGPNRAGCNSDRTACAPRAADGVASTLVCTPRMSGGVCGPAGTCRAGENCNIGSAGQFGGYQTGMTGASGFCQDGSSMSGYQYPGNGMPCMGDAGSCPNPEVCMGRPYTVGDLKRSIFGVKCRTKEVLGLNNCYQSSPFQQWWAGQQYRSECRRAYRNHVLAAHLHNKFNYFTPSGCCGEGCAPFGSYSRVYAAEPHYADARDSQVYASPMTGVPTTVPLAPNVRHQYNYSWGMPSSRITPISDVVLPRY